MKSFLFFFVCGTLWLLSSSSAAPFQNTREFSVQFVTAEDESVENIAEELKVFSSIYCGLRKATVVETNFNSARYEYRNGKDKYKFEVNRIYCDFLTQQ